jgi:hypothetical protein
MCTSYSAPTLRAYRCAVGRCAGEQQVARDRVDGAVKWTVPPPRPAVVQPAASGTSGGGGSGGSGAQPQGNFATWDAADGSVVGGGSNERGDAASLLLGEGTTLDADRWPTDLQGSGAVAFGGAFGGGGGQAGESRGGSSSAGTREGNEELSRRTARLVSASERAVDSRMASRVAASPGHAAARGWGTPGGDGGSSLGSASPAADALRRHGARKGVGSSAVATGEVPQRWTSARKERPRSRDAAARLAFFQRNLGALNFEAK